MLLTDNDCVKIPFTCQYRIVHSVFIYVSKRTARVHKKMFRGLENVRIDFQLGRSRQNSSLAVNGIICPILGTKHMPCCPSMYILSGVNFWARNCVRRARHGEGKQRSERNKKARFSRTSCPRNLHV